MSVTVGDDERMSVSDASGAGSAVVAPPNVRQLLKLMEREVAEKQPSNVINFLVDFLCKHYPEHLGGFAAIWNGDPNLERDRLQVVEFFRFQKLPAEMATHFINAGFDTLETLCTLTSESLDDIERFNNTRWLPGHKVRLQQSFSDIAGRVRAYRQEREKLMQMARVTTGHCDHPAIVTRTNLPGNRVPMLTSGPNPMPRIRPLPLNPTQATVTPMPYTGTTLGMSGGTFPSGPMAMGTRL